MVHHRPPRYLPVTESSVTLPPDVRRSIHDHLRTTLPRVPNKDQAGPHHPPAAGTSRFERSNAPPAIAFIRLCSEQIDPMKSRSTNAWLRGQLQAPT